jgi:hypothetical protein
MMDREGTLVKRVLIFAAVMLLGLAAWFLINSNTGVESIKVEQVAQMEINTHKNGSVNVIYTKEKNLAELECFVTAYNKAKRYRDDVGTTPDISINVTLDNGEKIGIAGGTQGFQIVTRHGKQFNIQGQELWDYFKKLL